MKALNVLSFVIMITVNAMANILPINGMTTGSLSDSYPNLFAPAGITFAIWGVIYLLLGGFVIHQFGSRPGDAASRVSAAFVVSSIANAAWIFSWHYRMIPVSMALMLVILVSLMVANAQIKSRPLNRKEFWWVRVPFSVYFGWITVATIANATTLLVSRGWGGFGLSQQSWSVIMFLVGALVGIVTMVSNRDVAYGLVIVWAYIGIVIRHTSGFAGKYPQSVLTAEVALALVVLAVIYTAVRRPEIRRVYR